MNFDFALFLVIGTFITGVIWAVDAYFFAPKRKQSAAELKAVSGQLNEEEKEKLPLLVDYARSFFPVLFIVLVLRAFIFEPFRIPSESMLPTLLVGDFILVDKNAYGVRLPVVNKKIIDTGSPERGDVAVFRYPENPSVDYIKRVVGLPGDRITYYNRVVYVNGEPIQLEKQGSYHPPGEDKPDSERLLVKEKLGEAEHGILITPRKHSSNGEFVVPQGQYFVMGDNRDNSNDSRFWGFVPDENLVGKAFMIWMNLDFYLDRIGSRIQ